MALYVCNLISSKSCYIGNEWNWYVAIPYYCNSGLFIFYLTNLYFKVVVSHRRLLHHAQSIKFFYVNDSVSSFCIDFQNKSRARLIGFLLCSTLIRHRLMPSLVAFVIKTSWYPPGTILAISRFIDHRISSNDKGRSSLGVLQSCIITIS